MESPVPNNPREKHAADSIPDFVGPERSTKLPKNAADIPRKKIAKENVNCTDANVAPVAAIIGLTNTLHAYTLPTQIWIPTALAAMPQRFRFIQAS